MTNLHDLLTEDAIRLDVAASTWQEAIGAAGALLEATGVADGRYTQAMIDSVVEHGPYIVLTPGFAFAHARPSDAVHRTGLSYVRLAQPVEFGHKTNDPVTLVVALAALDATTHRQAMAELAKVLANPARKAELDAAASAGEVLAVLTGGAAASGSPTASASDPEENPRAAEPAASSGRAKNKVLTVCGNGLGTSLFLKNTLEQVLDRWRWAPFITVEATDTISARGKAKEADFILTSGEIARALGDVGVPVRVIENFTSTTEIDAALRELYDI